MNTNINFCPWLAEELLGVKTNFLFFNISNDSVNTSCVFISGTWNGKPEADIKVHSSQNIQRACS